MTLLKTKNRFRSQAYYQLTILLISVENTIIKTTNLDKIEPNNYTAVKKNYFENFTNLN